MSFVRTPSATAKADAPKPPAAAWKVGGMWSGGTAIVVVVGYAIALRWLPDDNYKLGALLVLAGAGSAFLFGYLAQDWRIYKYRREHNAIASEFAESGAGAGGGVIAPVQQVKPAEKPRSALGKAFIYGFFTLFGVAAAVGLIAIALEEIAPRVEDSDGFQITFGLVVLASPFVGGVITYRRQSRRNRELAQPVEPAKVEPAVVDTRAVFDPSRDG